MNNPSYPEQNLTINFQSYEAKDKLEKTADQVKDKFSKTQALLSNYIKDHSIFSLGCSVLVGVIIGAMLRQ